MGPFLLLSAVMLPYNLCVKVSQECFVGKRAERRRRKEGNGRRERNRNGREEKKMSQESKEKMKRRGLSQ